MAMTSHVWTAVRRSGGGASELWYRFRSSGQAGIERLASETFTRAVKSVLVSAVAAALTFVVGSVAWIFLNSGLTTRDGGVVTGVREFTLWPVFWLAVAVFAVVVSVHVFMTRHGRH